MAGRSWRSPDALSAYTGLRNSGSGAEPLASQQHPQTVQCWGLALLLPGMSWG